MLVSERMSTPAITVNEDMQIPEALNLMRNKNIRRLPVVDKKGKLVGIVARSLAVPLTQRQIDRVDQGRARRSHHPGSVGQVMTQAKRQRLSQPRPGPPRCW